nr:helix-turn-helix transcriptional regulator [uncultured Oribacterium sp.]
MQIGNLIKKRRVQLGLSQTELANKLGFKSKASISRIELGAQSLPQNKILEMAKALDVSPEYLMGWRNTLESSSDSKVIVNNKSHHILDTTVDPLRIIINATDLITLSSDIDLAISYLQRRKKQLTKEE